MFGCCTVALRIAVYTVAPVVEFCISTFQEYVPLALALPPFVPLNVNVVFAFVLVTLLVGSNTFAAVVAFAAPLAAAVFVYTKLYPLVISLPY